MLTIRLTRVGKRNNAQFKLMLQEKTVAPGGRHVEILGSYSPHSKEIIIKEDRIKYWIEKGAFLSDTVHNLLVKKGVISEKKRPVKLPARNAEHSAADGPKKKVEEVKAEEVAEKPASAEATAGEPASVEVAAGEEAKPVEVEKVAEASAEKTEEAKTE